MSTKHDKQETSCLANRAGCAELAAYSPFARGVDLLLECAARMNLVLASLPQVVDPCDQRDSQKTRIYVIVQARAIPNSRLSLVDTIDHELYTADLVPSLITRHMSDEDRSILFPLLYHEPGYMAQMGQALCSVHDRRLPRVHTVPQLYACDSGLYHEKYRDVGVIPFDRIVKSPPEQLYFARLDSTPRGYLVGGGADDDRWWSVTAAGRLDITTHSPIAPASAAAAAAARA